MRLPDLNADPPVSVHRSTLGLLLAAHAAAMTVIFLKLPIHNADDLWNVELWGAWRPFGTEVLLPRDTYVLHAPVNIVARLVLGDGIASLAAASVVLNVIGFVLILNFVGFVAKRSGLISGATLRIQIVIGLLYAFVSVNLMFLLGRPNYRNVEIGLFLLAVQVVVRTVERDGRDRTLLAGAALFLGILSFNDPMFLICGVVPSLAVIGIRWLTGRDTPVERRAGAALIGGAVCFGLLRAAFGIAGIKISGYAPPIFSSLTDVSRTAAQTIEFVLLNFGATFSGRDAESPATLFNLARLALLGLVLFGVWRFRRDIPEPARLPLGAVGIFVAGILAASTFSSIGSFEGQNPRYLVPATALVIVLGIIPLVYGTDRFRRVLVVAILAVTAGVGLDLVRHVRGLAEAGVTTPQLDAMSDLAFELDDRGPSAGYAVFWVAVPVQYFAGQDVAISSVECEPEGPPVQANFANLDVPSADVDRSFVVLWDHPVAQCSREQIIDAFGSPVEEVRHEFDDGTWGHFTVLWFDGNVGTGLGRVD